MVSFASVLVKTKDQHSHNTQTIATVQIFDKGNQRILQSFSKPKWSEKELINQLRRFYYLITNLTNLHVKVFGQNDESHISSQYVSLLYIALDLNQTQSW